MDSPVLDVGIRLLAVLALVLANGFFVAAEFSIISVRKTRIDQLLAEGSRMARPVRRARDGCPRNGETGQAAGTGQPYGESPPRA